MADQHLQFHEVTAQIIEAFYTVYNELGYGFLENTYENALALVLREMGLKVEQQVMAEVFFRGAVVGQYRLDLVVNDVVIVELKAARALSSEHEAQLLNYLKATRYEVGLLLNFGVKPEFKRKSFGNDRKGSLSWTKRV